MVEVDSGHGGQGGGGLQGHVVEQEPGEGRVLGDVVDEAVPGEVAEVGHRLMGGVEQPQLHQFVGLDVGDQLHPDVFQWRPAGGEVVLQYPLDERFGQTPATRRRCRTGGDHGLVLVGGGRGDAVDHRVGEADLLGHPVAKLRVP